MSNWKKKMSMVLAMTLILSLIACGGQTNTPGSPPADSSGNGSQQVYVMKVNSVLADASPNAQGLHMFEEYLEEKSGGQIDVQLYTGGTLAASDELSVEMCMSGGCEMVVDPTFCLATKISDAYGYMFTCYPYIWKNRDSAYRYMNESETMSELAAIVEEQTDLKIMGWYDIGYNVVANNKRALKMPGDGTGLKCRVASIPIMLQTLEAFGPTGVAMAYGEVYTAMTQGTVDAVQTSTPNLQADLFYEQCNRDPDQPLSVHVRHIYE